MSWFYGLFFFCILYQIIYLFVLILSIVKYKKVTPGNSSISLPQPTVSLIICSKNEAENLLRNIPLILNQNYPDFEVIIVDDGSDDQTVEVVNGFKNQFSRVRLISISKEEKIGLGKKYALQTGIANTSNDLILLTDADCNPVSQNWISEMSSRINDQHKIVLGISPYETKNTFLNGLIEYETAQTALQYVGFALLGNPYMSVGRNVCCEKKLWTSKPWTNEEFSIASGDDDLAIQKLATGMNTTVCLSIDSYILSQPKETLDEWIHQKLRHYESGKLYKSSHRLLLGAYLFTKSVLYISMLSFVFTHILTVVILSIFFLYLFLITILNFMMQKKQQLNSRWFLASFFDVIYCIFAVALGFVSLLKTNRNWK